ncbi:MAG TPA: nuclear transport factor 2 family protein [Chitinophagaceae bacterium]|nr:nuclear transport factor 2 family protein [Chitinophagaceae bacterium]
MKKIILATLILFPGFILLGQDPKITREINEQVWMIFIRSFGNGDEEQFKSVHSRDVVRVIQDDGQIFGYDEYFKKIPDSLRAKWANWKKNIELRFTQRISSDDKAFEVGFYKTTSTNIQTGEKRKSFGRFHVLLRKENGTWKIIIDADTGEGASEEKFDKASPMQL